MDINTVTLSGHIFDIRVNPTTGLYPVVEAKLSVNVGTDKDSNINYDEFNLRSYGKKNDKIAKLKEGQFVTICGKLKEDIRVNTLNAETVRSKTYVNIENLKTHNIEN